MQLQARLAGLNRNSQTALESWFPEHPLLHPTPACWQSDSAVKARILNISGLLYKAEWSSSVIPKSHLRFWSGLKAVFWVRNKAAWPGPAIFDSYQHLAALGVYRSTEPQINPAPICLPRDKTYFLLHTEVPFMPPGLDKLLKFCLVGFEQLLPEDEGTRPGTVNNFLNWKHCWIISFSPHRLRKASSVFESNQPFNWK